MDLDHVAIGLSHPSVANGEAALAIPTVAYGLDRRGWVRPCGADMVKPDTTGGACRAEIGSDLR